MPLHLARSTTAAALEFAGGAAAGTTAAKVAQGVIRSMSGTKLKVYGLLLAVLAGAGLGSGVAAWQAPPERSDTSGPPAADPGRPGGDGDPLPAGALARLGATHRRFVQGSVVFAPDGRTLLTGGRLWDVATGKLLRRFDDGRGQQPQSPALSADGRTFAGLAGARASLWEVATGRLLRQWGAAASAVALSPDGKTVITADYDKHVRFWDTATGEELRAYDLGVVAGLLSPGGKAAVSVSKETTLQVWDVAAGKEICRLSREQGWNLHGGVAFSPDGRLLATGAATLRDPGVKSDGGGARVWEVATGRELRQLGPDPAGTWAVAFSPDGKLLATGSGFGPVRLWDVATGRPAGSCRGYCSNVASLAFSPDGRTLATVSEIHESVVRLWEVPSGREVAPPAGGHPGAVLSVAFSPDGKTLVSGGRDGTVRLWDAQTGRERGAPLRAGDFQAIAALSAGGKTLISVGNDFTPDGSKDLLRAALAAPATVRLWDADTGRERRQFRGPDGLTQSVSLSPDGKVLAWSGVFGEEKGLACQGLQLWDVNAGKELQRFGAQPTSATFSPDGKTIALNFANAPLSLWGVSTGKKICDLPGHTARTARGLGFAFSPDGRTLASSGWENGKCSIHLCRLRADGTWVTSEAFPTPHQGMIWALTFSPDGQTLASAGSEGAVCVWEAATGGERRRFAAPDGATWSLAFAGDGRRLAAGNSDTTVLIWDVTGRLEEGRLRPARLSAAELKGLWADLAGADVARAGRAVWALAAAPAQAVPFLREYLRPAPRAEAVKERVARLIADLDSETFAVRQGAADELERLGETAGPALRQTLGGAASAQVRHSIRRLLETLEDRGSHPTSEALRSLRGAEVLGQVGTPEARRLLEALAGGEPGAWLTREAQAVLKGLGARPGPDKP
jgi:WD40 repeat protein